MQRLSNTAAAAEDSRSLAVSSFTTYFVGLGARTRGEAVLTAVALLAREEHPWPFHIVSHQISTRLQMRSHLPLFADQRMNIGRVHLDLTFQHYTELTLTSSADIVHLPGS